MRENSLTATPTSTFNVFTRLTTDWWLVELLSCLLSLLTCAAVIIVLTSFDGRPLPNWPYNVTLNSFLALLTTIAKAGLMIPITEALSQLKWVWFAQKRRPLVDFQTFDEASRGLIGGFKLLGTLKGR